MHRNQFNVILNVPKGGDDWAEWKPWGVDGILAAGEQRPRRLPNRRVRTPEADGPSDASWPIETI